MRNVHNHEENHDDGEEESKLTDDDKLATLRLESSLVQVSMVGAPGGGRACPRRHLLRLL